jgi:DNA gyrase subunit A
LDTVIEEESNLATTTSKKTTTKGKTKTPTKTKKVVTKTTGTVVQMDLGKALNKNMGDYSFNINLFRAFADINDGLKPVARRIAYAMHEKKLSPGGAYKKVAAVVGDVIGKYHPHGDASIVDALVKMAQGFYMNNPIVDGHGNFGSISGDEASAMRYIECRMTKYCTDLLEDIEKNAVDWKDNYDGSEIEPVRLPVKFPNLLINGSYGIGQAYISSIPPHKFGDVSDMAVKIIKNPNITLDEVANAMQPDYPTGGIIINQADLVNAYKTGLGTIKVRAKITKNKDGHLVVSQIPFMTNVGGILDKIQTSVKEEKIDGIADVIDQTNAQKGVQILIKIKKGHDPSVIENQLYKFTPLQTSLNLNLIAVDGLNFKIYNILEMFQSWIEYRRTTLKRIFNFRISKIRRRMHIIDGLLIALANIDDVVKIIKGASDRQDAQQKLIKKYKFSDIQAEAITDMKLYQLTGLNIQKLKDELKTLKVELAELSEYFSKPQKLDNFIIKELEDGKKKYDKPRRTEVTNIADEGEEAIIANTNHTVFITKQGYVKKLSLNINTQGTGGKGRSVGNMKDGDYIISAFNANNKDNVLCFTNQGRLLLVKVYEFKDTNLNAFGYLLNTYIQLRKDESVVSTLVLENEQYKNEDAYLLFVTKNGLVKRSSISHYNNVPKSGLIALKLNDDDSLVGVQFADQEYEIVIATSRGLGTRFSTSEISLTLRMSLGMKGISVDDGDRAVAFTILDEDSKTHLLVANSGGTGKRIEFISFQAQGRTKKAKIVTKLNPNEELVQILKVNDDDEVTLVGSKKMIKIKADDVPVLIRSSSPKTIFKLDKGEKVLDAISE